MPADGSAVPFDLSVNATGLRPPSLVRGLGLPGDDEGGLVVGTQLRLTGDSAVLGGGGRMAFHGAGCPGSACTLSVSIRRGTP